MHDHVWQCFGDGELTGTDTNRTPPATTIARPPIQPELPTMLRTRFVPRAALAITLVFPAVVNAQMPGVAVLQNAFANPGVTAAVNAGGGSGTSTYALAGAWAPADARYQVSAGIGTETASGQGARTAYGLRLAIPVLSTSSGSLGAAVLGGIGGAALPKKTDASAVSTIIPIGAAVGYRRSIGATHGISVYGTPIYELVQRSKGHPSENLFRASAGLDAGITSAIGATVGVEFGQAGSAGRGSPAGTMWGAAVSYAFGRP